MSTTLDDLGRMLVDLRAEVTRLAAQLESRRSLANGGEPIAVAASEVARLLSIQRDEVYQMHHAGTLNGFRPYPKSHLKFLVSEVREVAAQMADERRDA